MWIRECSLASGASGLVRVLAVLAVESDARAMAVTSLGVPGRRKGCIAAALLQALQGFQNGLWYKHLVNKSISLLFIFTSHISSALILTEYMQSSCFMGLWGRAELVQTARRYYVRYTRNSPDECS